MNSKNAERGVEASGPEAETVHAGAAQAKTTQAETPQAGTAQAETAERDALAVIEALNAENSQLKDRVLRTLAEMENLRRRTDREVSDAKTYGVTNFARDMLTVVDNLSRAREHLPSEALASAEPSIRSMIEGVELTARDLEAVLGRHGVKKLDPKGQKFDPNFHQAIFEAPDETVPAGTVSQVVQTGWTIGDRVLRPAMVGVSKGGPKAAPKEEPASSATGK
jgi:molecular chaperone GrpE